MAETRNLLVDLWKRQDRRGKESREGYIWCAECGAVELPCEGGDLCESCIPRVNKQEQNALEARRRAESGQTDEQEGE